MTSLLQNFSHKWNDQEMSVGYDASMFNVDMKSWNLLLLKLKKSKLAGNERCLL